MFSVNMIKMKAYKPSAHIAVRDCDDDLSDDVDDDVFIRDRKARTVRFSPHLFRNMHIIVCLLFE